jgi:hypothetical protein
MIGWLMICSPWNPNSSTSVASSAISEIGCNAAGCCEACGQPPTCGQGGGNAWPRIGSLPSPGCRPANGRALAPPTRSNGSRTTNPIERLHEEFKRRIKTQTALPSAETATMLFWALLASGQITMRKVDGWQSLTQKLADNPIDLAA